MGIRSSADENEGLIVGNENLADGVNRATKDSAVRDGDMIDLAMDLDQGLPCVR